MVRMIKAEVDMDKRKIALGLLLAVLAGTGLYWQQSQAATDSTQAVIVASRKAEKTSPVLPEAEKQQDKAVKTQKQCPAKDEFVYTFEGDKVYIAAGSVSADKKNHQWQAQVKHIDKQGAVQLQQVVFFKQEGSRILTRSANDGADKWRAVDEMDRSVYKKVTDISGVF